MKKTYMTPVIGETASDYMPLLAGSIKTDGDPTTLGGDNTPDVDGEGRWNQWNEDEEF